jgi:hypothetical protein
MAQLVTSRFHDDVLQRDTDGVGATFVLKPITTEQLLAALYRTLLREPQADGSVAPAPPRLESQSEGGGHRRALGSRLDGQGRARRKKRRDTFPYLTAWRRPVS